MLNPHFELFKILDRRYVSGLMDGNLYMNSVRFFRGAGNTAQNDPLEGACEVVKKDRLKQMGIPFSEDSLQMIHDDVLLLSESHARNNLFCLYCMQVDDENKIIQKPSTELREFDEKGTGKKVVVHIKNTEEFIRRLDAGLQKLINERAIEYGIYGTVKYKSAWINADEPGDWSVFRKEPRFEYQSEWRLCILRYVQSKDAFVLPIGNLRDVVEEISLEEFLSYPETFYPQYQAIETISSQKNETYRVFASSSAISHLMNSYAPQPTNQPNLSDQAKADWHYTQFLHLSDRQPEIDTYLTSRLEEYKDLEHMELLVNYRLSKNEWVQATDAFNFMLQNSPEEIQQNPGRFFFQLHTILMQHHEVADASRLLQIATKDYSLPPDLEQIMLSDCLLALGFYDKAAKLFEDARNDSNDPIIDYNLAVCYFYLLRFEEAQECLNRYKTYFSNSPKSSCQIQTLQSLLSCFISCQPLSQVTGEYALKHLSWDSEIGRVLTNKQAKELLLGIDALWKIETAQKWKELNKFQVIKVCTLTIHHIIELYQQTGDIAFYHLVEHIRRQKNLEILSPEIDYYLAVDYKLRELPDYCKMEQALHIQSQQDKNV